MQVAFFKGFIDTAKAPPPWLRMVNKRGTFFLPLDPRRTPSASLPKLLKRHAQPYQLQCQMQCNITCCSAAGLDSSLAMSPAGVPCTVWDASVFCRRSLPITVSTCKAPCRIVEENSLLLRDSLS